MKKLLAVFAATGVFVFTGCSADTDGADVQINTSTGKANVVLYATLSCDKGQVGSWWFETIADIGFGSSWSSAFTGPIHSFNCTAAAQTKQVQEFIGGYPLGHDFHFRVCAVRTGQTVYTCADRDKFGGTNWETFRTGP